MTSQISQTEDGDKHKAGTVVLFFIIKRLLEEVVRI